MKREWQRKETGREKGRGNSVQGRILAGGRAWIELDRNALRQNVETLRRRLPKGCKLMPAVKADAYGHGASLIAKELSALGVDAFCVASAWEGAELREKVERREKSWCLAIPTPPSFPCFAGTA